MEHLDPESIALTAIGEAPSDEAQARHLLSCGVCQQELAAMRATVSVARASLGEGALSTPSGAVWTAVQRELGFAAGIRPSTAPASFAPVTELKAARARRERIRRFLLPVAASAAAAALVAGGVLWWGTSAPRDPGVTLASARLDALPAWEGASGAATVVETADGDRVVTVTVDRGEVNGDVVREVWLLTPEVDGLISLGLLHNGSGSFTIPAEIDLEQFPIVDVSVEPVDGDPAHSGDSIVRGALDL